MRKDDDVLDPLLIELLNQLPQDPLGARMDFVDRFTALGRVEKGVMGRGDEREPFCEARGGEGTLVPEEG